MVRKVTFTVRPAPTLGALLAFAQATRTHRGGFGERLEREVRLALESSARTLEPILGLLRWLSRRGLARSSGYVDVTGLAAETTVTFDLRSAVAAALDQGPRIDGRAYADLYSLRSLVRALRKTELVAFDGVLLGRQADTARALLRAVEAACRETALSDESVVPRVFVRPTPNAAQPAEVARAPEVEAPSAPRAKGARPPKTTRPKGPSPATAPAPTAEVSAGSFGGSFGGLPDDATSPPITPEVPPEAPLSARGLTVDAEFFLESARLKTWPCSAKVLSRTRRAVLIELHPDRAGEGSEARFRSALKGFEDLAKVLSAMPERVREAKVVAPPPAPTPPPTPVSAAPAAPPPPAAPAVVASPSSAIGQWPPPAPTAMAPAEIASHPPKRQSFKRSSKA